MTYLIYAFFSLLVCTVLIPTAVKLGMRLGIVDCPSARKVHEQPIPRTGGLAMLAGALVPLAMIIRLDPLVTGFVSGALVLGVFGVWDDLKNIDFRIKLLGQVAASLVLVLVADVRIDSLGQLIPGHTVHLGPFSIPLTLFFLLACINIINLSDGLDGLAGGISLLILTCAALLSYINQNTLLLVIIICVLGALVGFMRYNVHPAIIFMGDTGSQFLGFSLGCAMLILTQGNTIYSPVLPLFLLGTPVLDTASVILERLMRGRSIFSPDRNHLHHKLLNQGFNHSQAVVLIYILNLLFIIVGWNMRFARDWVLLVTYLGIIAVFLAGIAISYRNQNLVKGFAGLLNSGLNILTSNRFPLVSRQFFSTMAWRGFFLFFALFYLLRPWSLSIPLAHALVAVLLMVLALALRHSSSGLYDAYVRIMLYAFGLYLVGHLGEAGPVRFVLLGQFDSAQVLVSSIAVLYTLALILTPEKLPLDGLDFLIIGVVLFLFFLPTQYNMLIEFHAFLAKVLVLGLAVNLIYSRLERNRRFLRTLLLYTVVSVVGAAVVL